MSTRRDVKVAAASVAVTLIVGVAASATTYVTTRQTTSSQEAIAKGGLVFGRRSAAYLQAVIAANEWRYSRVPAVRHRAWVRRWSARLPTLRARIEIYAPAEALKLFDPMMSALLRSTSIPAVTSKVLAFRAFAARDLSHMAARARSH